MRGNMSHQTSTTTSGEVSEVSRTSDGTRIDLRKRGLAKRSASLSDVSILFRTRNSIDMDASKKDLVTTIGTSTSTAKTASGSSRNMEERERSPLDLNKGSGSRNDSIDARRRGLVKRSASISNLRKLFGTSNFSETDERKRGLKKRSAFFSEVTKSCSTGNIFDLDECKHPEKAIPSPSSNIKKGAGSSNDSKLHKRKRRPVKRSASFSNFSKDYGTSDGGNELDRRNVGLKKRSASLRDLTEKACRANDDGKKGLSKKGQGGKSTSTLDLKRVSESSNGKQMGARKKGLEKMSASYPNVSKDSEISNKMDKRRKGLKRSASFSNVGRDCDVSSDDTKMGTAKRGQVKKSASLLDISEDCSSSNIIEVEESKVTGTTFGVSNVKEDSGNSNDDKVDKSKRCLYKRSTSFSDLNKDPGTGKSNEKDKRKRRLLKRSASFSNFSKEDDGETIEDVKEDARKKRQEKKSSSSTSDLKKVSGNSNSNKIDARKRVPEKKSVTFSDLKECGTSNKMDKKRRGLLRSESFSNRKRNYGTSDDTKTGIVKRRLLKRSASCSDISRDSGTSNHGSEMDARKRRSEEKNSASTSDLSEVGLAQNDTRKKCQKECERKLKGKRVMQKLKSATSNSSTVKDEEKAVIECEEKNDEKVVGDLTADDMAIVAEARAAEEEEKMILILETRLKVIEAMKKLDMENIEAWKIEKKRKLQQKRFRKFKDDIEMKQRAIQANGSSSKQCSLIEDEKQNNILLQGYVEILQRERERCMVLNTQHRNQYRHYVALWEQVKSKSKAEEIQNDNLNAIKSAVEMLQAAIKSRQKKYENNIRMKMKIKKAIQDIVQLLGRRCNDIFLFLDVKNLAAAVEPEYDLFLTNDSYTEDITEMTESSDVSYFVASENPIVFFDPLQRADA